MSNSLGHVKNTYTTALQHYLAEPDEEALLRAYELGRGALADGLGVLDMATVHSHAIASVIVDELPNEKRARVLDAQKDFFVEALSPFEMAHRAFREANTVLRRLNDTLEDQAKRIAYSLHDEAGQLLASVHFVVADTASRIPDENAKELAKVQGLLHEIEERLRDIAHELRPPVLEEIGLARALDLVGESVAKRWGLPVTVHATLTVEMHPTIETVIYRIAQEALTNAARHADATGAEVELWQTEGKVICSIRDDGIGFGESSAERKRPGLGLPEMKERVSALGGVLRITPNNNRGTNLTIEIPLED